MDIRHTVAAVLLAALVASPVAMAQGKLELTTESLQEVTVKGKDGKPQKKVVPAAMVVPGTEVIYRIRYRNTGANPADKVVIDNPLPKEMTYLGGSAEGRGARFEVSVDGGASFGNLLSLRVTGADGNPRPAQPADVTHLRWTLAAAVPAGQEGSVSYRAVLK